jgi:hypothetical protein
MLRYTHHMRLWLPLLGLLAVTACKKKENPQPDPQPADPTGSVSLRLSHMAGTEPLQLQTPYINSQGDTVRISKFHYYISNVRLSGPDGSYTEPEGYHLLRHDEPSSLQLSLGSVPVGTYTTLSFLIGVDSLRNVSGAQTGALDPIHGMFWDWNTGYIMAKLEGTSPAAGSANKNFVYHVGGFKGANSGLRTVSLQLPAPLTVTDGGNARVYMHADVLRWFGPAPHAIDLSSLYFRMNVDAGSASLADNYARMFGADSVRHQ